MSHHRPLTIDEKVLLHQNGLERAIEALEGGSPPGERSEIGRQSALVEVLKVLQRVHRWIKEETPEHIIPTDVAHIEALKRELAQMKKEDRGMFPSVQTRKLVNLYATKLLSMISVSETLGNWGIPQYELVRQD